MTASSNALNKKSKVTTRLRLRRDFSRYRKPAEIPNLIKIQWQSYQRYLQELVAPEKREDIGLQAVFKSVFPIRDYNGTASLEFVSYGFGEPKYDTRECAERGMTWAAPLKVTVQLVLWDVGSDNTKQIRDIKEQEVYFGEIPLMTQHGTFIVNGTERVIVSQLHRSPGVFFDHDRGKSHSSGKLLYSARIIPYRGSWLDFEFDVKDVLHVRIDRRRKQNASVLLRALGMGSEEILLKFYKLDQITVRPDGSIVKRFFPDQLEGQKSYKEIVAKGGKPVVKQGQKFNRASIRRIQENAIEFIDVDPDTINTMVSARTLILATENIHHPVTKKLLVEEGRILIGWNEINRVLPESLRELDDAKLRDMFSKFEIILAAGEAFRPVEYDSKGKVKNEGTLAALKKVGITEFDVLYTRDNHIGDALLKTLTSDGLEPEREDLVGHFSGRPHKEALIEIYKRLRPGDPPRIETAETNFNNLFFNPERYDLSAVGRLKMNYKLHFRSKNLPQSQKNAPKIGKKKDEVSGTHVTEGGTLATEDIIETIRYLLELRSANDPVTYSIDDIDHLGNRRVRSVGELVENQFRIGLVRMERAIKERMSIQDIETLMPQDLINYKPVSAVIKEFFGSNQLSQFMDQNNPLSEITHKRRLSALGPGGLQRERAGFEVRDVHPTHYGRVCPIETPEGPNIGLISSLATYARVNEYGFVETPYRVVESGVVTDRVQYLSAMEEAREVIAQANAQTDEGGKFIEQYVTARKANEFVLVPIEEVTLMDVSPSQLVSAAAALIPFLENDDANRALMGSNMQRQAVPLLKTAAPFVGTGMEKVVARDSGATIVARRDGVVESVDATRIVLKADKPGADPLDTGVDIYNLTKYRRSNQNTCINQRPIVRPGDTVRENEVIADGQSTEMGELALGQNVLVAFMPWNGYNYEDSILINERIVRDDVFTSIHIEEFECIARDTKLGNEEITRDIPNVGEEALKNLDESGIIRIGAEVRPGDILVGKITPKSETQLSPEEKLLRAIFGEKAGEVRDTSLRCPPGVEGTVIGAHVFSRRGAGKDERMLEIEKAEIARLEQDQRDEIRILRESALKQLVGLLDGKPTTARLSDEGRKQLIAKGDLITRDVLESIPFEYLRDIQVGDETIHGELNRIVVGTGQLINNKRAAIAAKIKRLKKGDELPPGVIKLVKVFVAVKRRLSVGDKMAGRHGNKGVLSRIVPEEDMPYLPDGTPVDMVLNPLGVPSRMNVGQILETHIGWACYGIGRKLREIIEQITDPGVSVRSIVQAGTVTKDLAPDAAKAKVFLKGALQDESHIKFVDSLDDLEVLEYAQRQIKGMHIAAPVFEAPNEQRIRDLLKLAELPEVGQTMLYDGKTGQAFTEKVTVGVMYMLKLHHLVDEKIHARSIGPYSLVTQQPLGGKAQFGGQRLGEMEVWALEAYGAAYSLQEFLTVKSDDVAGRTRMYEAIVKGEHVLEPGLPESFNVMCKELMSLGLDVELVERTDATAERTVEDATPTSPALPTLPVVPAVPSSGESPLV
ncbi:MAG: DNA-directed RNA polymerase subunit beta [Deltaproteobacteria bacterium]|nr:DNA-directed RNA polymerase subunit beta [Deltaproteobacteria bacterium]